MEIPERLLLKNSRICSDHFTTNMFYFTDQTQRLRPNAEPTVVHVNLSDANASFNDDVTSVLSQECAMDLTVHKNDVNLFDGLFEQATRLLRI